jgi:hypothetical protein
MGFEKEMLGKSFGSKSIARWISVPVKSSGPGSTLFKGKGVDRSIRCEDIGNEIGKGGALSRQAQFRLKHHKKWYLIEFR